MLGGVDLLREGLEGVGRLAGDAGLAEVGAAVDLGVDPMDRAAGFRHAGIPGLTDAVEAGEGGQEARVEVDDAAGEGVEEGGLDHAHEAREHHQVDLRGLEGVGPGLLAFGRELRLERPRVEEAGGDAVLRAELQHLAGRDVAPDPDYLGLAQPAFGLGAEDRVGVGAATGTEEGDAHDGKVSAGAVACKRIFDFGL